MTIGAAKMMAHNTKMTAIDTSSLVAASVHGGSRMFMECAPFTVRVTSREPDHRQSERSRERSYASRASARTT